jgi:hypothetical protein
MHAFMGNDSRVAYVACGIQFLYQTWRWISVYSSGISNVQLRVISDGRFQPQKPQDNLLHLTKTVALLCRPTVVRFNPI